MLEQSKERETLPHLRSFSVNHEQQERDILQSLDPSQRRKLPKGLEGMDVKELDKDVRQSLRKVNDMEGEDLGKIYEVVHFTAHAVASLGLGLLGEAYALELKSPDVRLKYLNTIIATYSVLEMEEDALRLASELEKRFQVKKNQETMAACVTALLCQDRVEEAEDLVTKMEEEHGVKPHAAMLEDLVRIYGGKAQLDEAERILREAETRFRVVKTTALINVYVWALCHNDMVSKAHEIATTMESLHGVKPNTVTVTTLVEWYADKGDYKEVEKILDLFEDQYGVKKNMVTMKKLLNALKKAGKAKAAKSLSRDIYNKKFPMPEEMAQRQR